MSTPSADPDNPGTVGASVTVTGTVHAASTCTIFDAAGGGRPQKGLRE
jgi:hypothetical protein